MSRWSPYVDNGGSAVAIAGPDFATIVADTRCSKGYSILSRTLSKVCKLTESVCLVSCGMRADIEALHKKMKIIVSQYKFEHGEEPSVEALASRLSVELYSRRMFPYYAVNMLAGVSAMDGGQGKVYSYDAIGSTEASSYGATGSGQHLLLPVLDLGLNKTRRVKLPTKNQDMNDDNPHPVLLPEDAVKLGVDALTAATERNIHTGDFAEAWLITKDGGCVQQPLYSLRQD